MLDLGGNGTRFSWLSAAILVLGASVFAAEPEAEESEPTVRLNFVGDVMLDCLPGKVIARGDDPFAPFASLLADADYTVGNLECVVATRGEAYDKPWTFRAHPRSIPLLTKHFNAVSLANNHTGDFGDEAFVEQLELLSAANLPAFGGGRNWREAHRPLIVELKGIRLALLGYNEFKPRSFEATADSPGVAWSVDEQVLDDIAAARKQHRADLVIPFMHWGWELEPEPNDRQRELSRKMIDAGADLVVGAHPHCTQGTDTYQGKLIVYSLGNFVFDGFEEPEAHVGWLLRLQLRKTGLVSWDTVVAKIDAEGIPHPDPNAESPRGTPTRLPTTP